jgi:hypothetical protein
MPYCGAIKPGEVALMEELVAMLQEIQLKVSQQFPQLPHVGKEYTLADLRQDLDEVIAIAQDHLTFSGEDEPDRDL